MSQDGQAWVVVNTVLAPFPVDDVAVTLRGLASSTLATDTVAFDRLNQL